MSADGATDRLRQAYLDLVKRAVTNYLLLGGTERFGRYSSSARYSPDVSDWTIEPLARPLTLQSKHQLELIETQLLRLEAEGVPGDLIEAGVWRGGAVIFMRALLEAYAIPERRVIAADSFAGIPLSTKFRHDEVNKWTDRWEASLPEVRAAIDRFGLLDDRVVLLEGLFADTLPKLKHERLALIRLDSDAFDSADTSLEHLYPILSTGGVVIVDDWHLIGCRIAVDAYRKRIGIAGEVQVTANNAWWIKQESYGLPDVA